MPIVSMPFALTASKQPIARKLFTHYGRALIALRLGGQGPYESDLEVVERQKIVRLVIKQIIVNGDALTVQHSIPILRTNASQPRASYLLCTRSNHPSLGGSLFPVTQHPCFHHSGFQPFA